MAEVSDDILLAYPPIGMAKLQRLMSLPERVTLTVALDSVESAAELAAAATEYDRPVGVYVELDVGLHRVGVSPTDEMLKLVRFVAGQRPLVYRGISFYPGHIRAPGPSKKPELVRLGEDLRTALELLDQAGLRPGVVSGGSTPTLWDSHLIEGVTEIRPGTYVFNDRATAQAGACHWDDCALTVLATVVSIAVPGQAVVDAGSKGLGREPSAVDGDGFGALLDRPEVTVSRLSEEHGILDLGRTTWRPQIGERVRIVPNHGCIVVHLHEMLYGLRGNRIETSWPVVARGRLPLHAGASVNRVVSRGSKSS